ncbi:MAG: hypothetical protein M3512_11180 [Bacteroidota bacterium]|nr:hypothetical protein [Bacteroidota bacterium]
MKFKSTTVFVLFFVCNVFYAQAQWNWPDDKEKAERLNVLYNDELKSENYRAASNNLNWLLHNAPNLNPAIYINGAKIYEALADAEKNAPKKQVYADSALLMYDMRMKHFNDEASVTDRKAYTAYKYKSDVPDYQGELLALFKKTFELNGSKVMDPNTLLYMNTVRKYQNAGNKKKLTTEQVLEIYENIGNVFDEKAASQANNAPDKQEKLNKLREQVDGILADVVAIDCKFVENNYGPKFQANPGDIKLARKIVNYSVTGKCTDTPLFLQAAEAVNNDTPDFGITRVLGIKYKNEGDYDKALSFYNQSIELTDDNTRKADIHFEMADIAIKRGQKATARDQALKAASLDPGKKESAYTLIGDLYMGSFDQCKGGVNIVNDRGVFLAAYEAYQKAGNSSRMAKAKEGFPSAEEIFNSEMEVGQKISVGCWINETLAIQKR